MQKDVGMQEQWDWLILAFHSPPWDALARALKVLKVHELATHPGWLRNGVKPIECFASFISRRPESKPAFMVRLWYCLNGTGQSPVLRSDIHCIPALSMWRSTRTRHFLSSPGGELQTRPAKGANDWIYNVKCKLMSHIQAYSGLTVLTCLNSFSHSRFLAVVSSVLLCRGEDCLEPSFKIISHVTW